jgi:putative membrane protein
MHRRLLTSLSWVLVALFAGATLVRGLAPGLAPPALLSALVLFLPPVFFFVHGLLSYRLRDLLVFAAITLVVSNLFENMSVLTGFPFGRYVYTDTLGPKVFLVPALIGPAYLGTGYLTWTIARVIVGATDSRLPGHRVVSVPLLASLMMVSWDLALDPIFSTIYQSWLWLDGGRYFGVPFGNFMGWLLTTFVFLQLFALYLRRQQSLPTTHGHPSKAQACRPSSSMA